ncbi:MAG: putative C-S lyase [Anaerolineae bacterium]|nr:putative C-S lyase [Anaerolineae bacterium]
MTYDLDHIPERRGTDSEKWNRYPPDVLPMWVADMDFRSPEPVIQALRERVEHGIFGYGAEPKELREVIVARLERLYGWRVSPEALVFVPGVVTGFNMACQALTQPGDGILVQTPVYPPILNAPGHARCTRDEMELTQEPDGRYTVDWDRFAETFTPRTRVFLLCNPHNPVGRVFTRQELARMAEACLHRRVVIVSDEIHCDLVYRGVRHTPIAALDPEVEAQTITLMAPSKTYNIPGLQCSLAIIPNPALRERFRAARDGLVPEPNIMGYVAALAAYRDGDPWLQAVLQYLEQNRDLVHQFVARELPGVRMAKPEGTYLAWLDCREAGIPGNPHQFFVQEAKVALNDGADFGRGGEGFVRLNFGCPRPLLMEGLHRMKAALAARGTTKGTS